jgi:pimeloyl-ACP methyl ester carboxylesterase
LFAANGIAALSIDKRGYGGSEGDGPSATLQDNADDAAAAVAYLASRSDILAGGIGLIGTSRGGWTAPMAAARRPNDIAFIVASSGGPIGIGEQERYSRLRSAAAAGASDLAQREAARVIDDYFAYLASDGRERGAAVSTNWTRYGDQPWYRAMRMPAADPTVGPWPPTRRVFAGDLRLDAQALYDQVRVPVLFLYGAEDALFPIEQVVAAAQRVAQRLPGSEVQVIAGANHSFSLPARPGDVSLTAPAYFQTLIRWSRERLIAVRANAPGTGRNAGRRRGSGGSGR